MSPRPRGNVGKRGRLGPGVHWKPSATTLAGALEVAIETLYDRLGGTEAITDLVDELLTRCAADDHGERLTVARGHEHTRSSNHGGDLGRVLTSSPGSR